jgi:ubiquinone/menaquinone biosynthesis C-methylase UbiE
MAIGAVQQRIGQEALDNVEPLLADGARCPVPDHVADVIYALDMFHNVDDPAALLREWRRLIKPGGHLILEDGHQSRDVTRAKLARSDQWRIVAESAAYVRCEPVL